MCDQLRSTLERIERDEGGNFNHLAFFPCPSDPPPTPSDPPPPGGLYSKGESSPTRLAVALILSSGVMSCRGLYRIRRSCFSQASAAHYQFSISSPMISHSSSKKDHNVHD